MLIAGGVTSLMASGSSAFGGLALWGDSQKDERGYLSTDSHQFAASTHAIATENLDMDLDGVEELVDSTSLGNIRIDVAPQSGKPVFAGIARTDELSRVPPRRRTHHGHRLDFDHSRRATAPRPARARRVRPRPSGSGQRPARAPDRRPSKWDIEDGDWSIVVMNADGSSGVQADISAGAKVPYLNEIGWSALGGGRILVIAAAALLGSAYAHPATGPERRRPAAWPRQQADPQPPYRP